MTEPKDRVINERKKCSYAEQNLKIPFQFAKQERKGHNDGLPFYSKRHKTILREGAFMMTFLTIFATSFFIALSGALMPGPLLTATISESSQRGFIAGPLLIVGHAILEVALVSALLLGLAPFLQMPVVFVTTALAGSAILFWMAFGMLRTLPTLGLSWEVKQTKLNHPLVSGILLSLSNPYWIIWWASIGVGYIIYAEQFGVLGVVFFFAGHISADLAWYSFISAAVSGGRRFLTDRLYRGLIAFCAIFLVAFAGYFAYSGLDKLKGFFL